jgi:DNA-directed RNA polymerase specialized sigma24 family protein
LLKLSRRQVRHEDVVAEQYAMLRRAALHLARGDDTEAGDLLHDMFVRFLLLRPELERIDHLDGYLYTMLRNVYLSRLRRHGRRNALITDGVDVDLLASMVHEPQAGDRLRMHDDLIRIVAHACERTRVSRGASAWVLRCLHGYYPAEIAHVMKMPPRAVDRALHVARREAVEELRRPSRRLLARLRGTRRWRDLHAGVDASDPLDAVQALRARVFASVAGPCLTEDQLVDLYRPESDDPAGTLVMAHVVACAGCLDRINHHLGLSPLNMRDPLETNGTRRPRGGGAGGNDGDEGSGEGRGSARGGAARARGKGRNGDGLDPLLRRTHETITSIVDHVPQELRIAANGFDLGAQPVTGTVTVQELAVRLAEALAFIEIFDERGTLVCYWPAPLPIDGALEEHITIDLADGRRVELEVSLTDDCPRLRMRYTDERVSTVGLRAVRPDDGRPLVTALAFTGAAHRVPWWRWIVPSRIVPSPRIATAVGALVVLWMIFVGPVTTWAAIEHIGRAAADAIRTLISSPPSAPSSSSAPVPVSPGPSPSAPAAPAARAEAAAPVFSSSELADLEMDARVMLHAMKADLGEDITLTASPAGVVVQGVVASGARRVAIARAFTGRDGVRVQVRTVHDVAAVTRMKGSRTRGASEGQRGARGAAAGDATTPVAVESPESLRPILEDVLVARLPDPPARAAFVNGTLAHADEALTRMWALRRLAERYPPREVTRLGPRSSQALATLVDDHAAALDAAIDALTTRVTPLLAAAGTVDAAAGDAEERLSIMQMFAQVNALHAETHALLAGGSVAAIASSATPATPATPDHPDARQSAARTLLTRLRHVTRALNEPDFAHEMRPR